MTTPLLSTTLTSRHGLLVCVCVCVRQFHALAARAVENLRAAGFWADYIDPSSGKAVRAPCVCVRGLLPSLPSS